MALRLVEIFDLLIAPSAPVGFRAYDGSARERHDGIGTVEIRTPRALRYLATAPGELGLARAYVMGDIEIHGDLHGVLVALVSHRVAPLPRGALLRSVRRWMLHPPPVPPEEAPAPWRRGALRHSPIRDSHAIAHHYDLSNDFYELVLGRSMAYSCAVFERPGATLEEAQLEKFDLVCRKLGLQAGERLLDIGAGWGGLVRHAAEHYGVRAVGVTISREQVDWAGRAIARAGLARRAEVRLLDWRSVAERGFDAISSVGTMEHVGTARLGAHFRAMAAHLRSGGRMLNHAITRASNRQPQRPGPFTDRYVFPDGELQSLGTVVAAMHDHGLEVRNEESLREHYALTLRAWGENLERNWAAAVADVGERRARAWRLYMAISRIGFELNRLQIHQVLGVRAGRDGACGGPPRPVWPRCAPAPDARARDQAEATPAAAGSPGELLPAAG
jgi:cyclopropane-fatty-acyl-phospholipid synthase